MQWKILPKVSDDLKIQLLHNRGLNSAEEIEKFLNPEIRFYLNDLEIPGIKKAVKRILEAIERKEQIIVYGDYDVDGICATSIIYKALTSLGANILPFIPHRDRDGYGLSKSGLEAIKQKYPETKVVITVDNGIVSIEQAKWAKKLGFDLIVTDHHLPLDQKPEAVAIVHSIKMCGTAVAWCLIREMVDDQLKIELLQFVAIGTIADQMTLVGLNRALVHEGLKELNRSNNPGIKALVNVTNLELGKISSFEIGHILAPKLNAAGRMDTAMPSLKLLCTNRQDKAMEFARELMRANTNRQDLMIQAIEEAIAQINREDKIHIVYSPNWISGIIGLVAARLSEEYNRPAIAISVGETVAKGSARSSGGINIVESLKMVRELLIDVGGHSGAAGFSMEPKNIGKFKLKLSEAIESQKIERVDKVLEIESTVSARELKRSMVELMEVFEPFGVGNPKPILATQGMRLTEIKTVGDGKHLKFLADGIGAICFGMGDKAQILKNGQLVDLAYYLEINRFNGSESLQLKVKDVSLTK